MVNEEERRQEREDYWARSALKTLVELGTFTPQRGEPERDISEFSAFDITYLFDHGYIEIDMDKGKVRLTDAGLGLYDSIRANFTNQSLAQRDNLSRSD